MCKKNILIITGYIGLLAAIFVGIGEFLLHFDPLGRFSGSYEFMIGINEERTTLGHFIGVLSAPFYIVGFWHLMKMLEPASEKVSKIAFAIISYGIIIGVVWIGSRANISALVNDFELINQASLISLYDIRYENLLQITRVSVIIFSILFIWLILTGNTLYPKWIAVFNPFFLILLSFGTWIVIPSIGIYLMPIALNFAFAIIFAFSIYFSHTLKHK